MSRTPRGAYEILYRPAPAVGPGGWERVAAARTRADVVDELAGPLGWPAPRHGDIVRVLSPGGVDDALHIFDGARGAFRKAKRPPQVFVGRQNELPWPRYWEEAPVDLFSLTYALQGVGWRHVALAAAAALGAFARGSGGADVLGGGDATRLAWVEDVAARGARSATPPPEADDAAFFASREERSATRRFEATSREHGALTGVTEAARRRMISWRAAARLLDVRPASLHPYVAAQAVVRDLLDVLASLASVPLAGRHDPPGAAALAAAFRRAVPLSVVVAARTGMADPAPVPLA